MNRYSASETHFALLSIGEKRKIVLENELIVLTSRLATIDLAVSTGEGKSSVLGDGYTIGKFMCILIYRYVYCVYSICVHID